MKLACMRSDKFQMEWEEKQRGVITNMGEKELKAKIRGGYWERFGGLEKEWVNSQVDQRP